MKIMKGLSAAFAATCAFAAITAVASVGSRTGYSFYGGTQNDTIPTAGKMLPGEVAQDTTAFKGKPYEGSDIMLTARAYGDRIVLRWAPSDYAAWMRLNLIGYNIYRWDEKNHCDTLALALKPKTLEEFRAKYAPNDSVATIGYGLIYGDNLKKPTETREEPGSYGSMLEMYDDQVTSLAFAILASEWRQDVAEDMAMRFVDRNVRKGARYTYIIQPARRFENDNMFIKGKEVSNVENKPYVPAPYNVGLTDSITGQLAVTLYWTDKHNSSFEIERRVAGTQEWRRVETDPTKQIFATISWEKDTVEADLAGFLPLYYNERFTGNDWKPLCEKTLPADAREVKVDVTGLSTGMLVMAAYDEAGNVGYSMPVQLRISDMKAPDAPGNLRAEVSADDGTITLRWDKPADDDVAYYELAYANDTTHHFLMRNQGQLKDTMFVDTVQMTVNQRFIYYKVRAVDYSNNTGEFSPILQVERPHITPPTQPHLDSAWVDNSGIHMDWVTGLDADMYYHRIYRRLENSNTWDLIAIVTAEDVLKASPDGVIHLTDKPQTNNTYYYEYMVVSFNRSEIASEPSLIFSARFADFTEAELGIKAVGTYDTVKDEARLSWEHKTVDGKQTPYYYCVYRKGKDEADYTFLCSTEPDMPLHTDQLLSPGESASYYVVVRFTDGRRSQPSNKVTITAPAKAPSKAK